MPNIPQQEMASPSIAGTLTPDLPCHGIPDGGGFEPCAPPLSRPGWSPYLQRLAGFFTADPFMRKRAPHRSVRLFRSSVTLGLVWLAIWLASTGLPIGLAEAQGLPRIIDPTGRSGELPPLEQLEPLKPLPAPEQILPPVRPSEPDKRLEKGPLLRVFVKHIQVVGSTVFPEAALQEVAAPYENREVTTEDLEELRRALTLLYVNEGYANSGAIIPDQAVAEGVVTMQIIEGVLTDIRVEGTQWFRPSYLEDRLGLSVGPPFNMQPLRDRMQLLLQDPRLERLNAELKPGARLGEAVLDVSVQEDYPIHGWLEYNNYQTPSVGEDRVLGTIIHQNVTGNGDQAYFQYGQSRGVIPLIDTSYTLPLTRYDTTFFVGYRRNDFTVVESTFKDLDIQSQSEIFTFTLRHPLYKTLTDEVAVSLTGERLWNKTSLLGIPFSFTPGYQDGSATVSALRVIQEWTHRTPASVLAFRSRFSVGLDVLGATDNSGSVPDGQFFTWLGQANWVKRFDPTGIELLNGMSLQVANDRLFPLEQFSVGGRYSVRGYRENTLVRDNAFLYSIEARVPVWTIPGGVGLVQLAPFIDVGRAWNAKGQTPDPQTLASIGIGLRVSLWTRLQGNIYWGQQLNHVPDFPDKNLQNQGVHVQVVWNVF
jgi:hemolysin activation/secretion protein